MSKDIADRKKANMGMDWIDRCREWRGKARSMGLTLDYMSAPEDSFTFDLNQGTIKTNPDPATVNYIVNLARDYDSDQNAILQLVARKEDLKRGFTNGAITKGVYWHRPYHVSYRGNEDKWVTLIDWLAQHDYIQEYDYA